MIDDIGRFTGRYLQVLGWIGAAHALVGVTLAPLFYDCAYIDLSFIFYFWAGACLIRHSERARKIVVFFSVLETAVLIWTMAKSLFSETNLHHVRVLGYYVWEKPVPLLVFLVCPWLLPVVALPGYLLSSRQARQEFARTKSGPSLYEKLEPVPAKVRLLMRSFW